MGSLQLDLLDRPAAAPSADAVTARLLELGRPKNTRMAYRKQWERFEADCAAKLRRALPASPRTIIDYLAAGIAAGLAFSTLKQQRAAIRDKHLRTAHADPLKDPLVRDFWTGYLIENEREEKPTLGVLDAGIRAVIAAIDTELREAGPFATPRLRLAAARDRALVLTLYGGLLTRSEAASLRRANVVSGPKGLKLRVERSPGRFRDVDIAYDHDVSLCPVRALGEWFRVADIDDGAAFRSIDQQGRITSDPLTEEGVKFVWRRRAGLAGLDARLVPVRALRDGAQKQAAYDGASDEEVLERAGLHEESRVSVSRRVARARNLGKSKKPAPATL